MQPETTYLFRVRPVKIYNDDAAEVEGRKMWSKVEKIITLPKIDEK